MPGCAIQIYLRYLNERHIRFCTCTPRRWRLCAWLHSSILQLISQIGDFTNLWLLNPRIET